ncbi:Uncharacterized protein PBTT_00221 [Plasmodiophora brassicae]|uniref:Uncharacterized protein n=1 Tax=Plasmodiophora brassicae TaxID=37360 RepID=A0A0G4J4G6_PLABS|nr:hypothetical protein PBRA_002514 [Plasmodiophora brassicae]SPQ93571.1 unnamed protein product [Plasmodiophora brassicae]
MAKGPRSCLCCWPLETDVLIGGLVDLFGVLASMYLLLHIWDSDTRDKLSGTHTIEPLMYMLIASSAVFFLSAVLTFVTVCARVSKLALVSKWVKILAILTSIAAFIIAMLPKMNFVGDKIYGILVPTVLSIFYTFPLHSFRKQLAAEGLPQ